MSYLLGCDGAADVQSLDSVGRVESQLPAATLDTDTVEGDLVRHGNRLEIGPPPGQTHLQNMST